MCIIFIEGERVERLFSKKKSFVPILFPEFSLLNSSWMHFFPFLLLLVFLCFHVNKVGIFTKKQKQEKMISPKLGPGVELSWVKSCYTT